MTYQFPFHNQMHVFAHKTESHLESPLTFTFLWMILLKGRKPISPRNEGCIISGHHEIQSISKNRGDQRITLRRVILTLTSEANLFRISDALRFSIREYRNIGQSSRNFHTKFVWKSTIISNITALSHSVNRVYVWQLRKRDWNSKSRCVTVVPKWRS
jgi:hypothetical protein